MTIINHLLVNLKSLFLAHPEKFTYSILALTILLIIRSLIVRSKLKLKDLDALGFYRREVEASNVFNEQTGSWAVVEKLKKKSITVYFESKTTLVFTEYNRAYDLEKFKSLEAQLSHIYQMKIVKIESRKAWFGQPKIVVHFENWSENFRGEQTRVPDFGKFLIGKDGAGKEVYQDFLGGDISLFIAGQKGSGKTQAIISFVHSFFKNPAHRELYDLIILDAKLNDFIVLNQNYGGEIYDTTDLNSFKRAIQSLERRCVQWNDLKRENNDKGKPVANYLNYNGRKPKNFLLIIDEAAQFLGSETVRPPGKDASEEEKKEYEVYQQKKALTLLIDHILSVHRFYGNVAIISSQSALSGDYSFSFTNLRTMLLSRGSSAQASQQLTGSQSMLLDPDLRRGKWVYISSGDDPKKVQTAFTTLKANTPERDEATEELMSQIADTESLFRGSDKSEAVSLGDNENQTSVRARE